MMGLTTQLYLPKVLIEGSLRVALQQSSDMGAALMVFYSLALETTQRKVEKAGGNIVKQLCKHRGNEFVMCSDNK